MKNLHCDRSVVGGGVEDVGFLTSSYRVIYGLNLTLLHQFVNSKQGRAVEYLIEDTSVYPLILALTQNSLQSVFNIVEHALEAGFRNPLVLLLCSQ